MEAVTIVESFTLTEHVDSELPRTLCHPRPAIHNLCIEFIAYIINYI